MRLVGRLTAHIRNLKFLQIKMVGVFFRPV
jgi:hypothetical protein